MNSISLLAQHAGETHGDKSITLKDDYYRRKTVSTAED